MDVISLTNQLVGQYDKIAVVLEKIGCEKIRYNTNKNYISSTRPEDGADNALGQLTYVDNLGVHQNTRSYSGNIFTLVMDVKNVSFPKALELVAAWTGIKAAKSISIKFPFSAFYKKISKAQISPELNLTRYSETDLPPTGSLSLKYIKDGVSAQVQEAYGVRYCHDNDAIIVPIQDYQGRLIGAKARSNDPNCDVNKRFWAYLEYPKTLTLFGYCQNYRYIIQKKIVVIVEAEKSVMIAASFGCFLCLAIAGHNISDTQAKYIKALGAEKIYVAFDESICEDELIYESKKLVVDNNIYRNKVGYVFDDEHKYLEIGKKESPLDKGKEIFNKLIREKTRWLNAI